MKKILLVEDDRFGREIIRKKLSNFQIEVFIADDGINGLELLKQNPEVDLIITDIMMPRMDGLEMVSEIKKDELFRDLPVIILTAKSRIDDITKGFQVGAIDYITKPFQMDELVSRVNSAIQIKYLQDELKKKNNELKASNDEIIKLNDLKDEFLSICAHDLKSPLNNIIGYVNLIETNQSDPSKIKNYLGKVQKNCSYLMSFIDDLLDLSVLESGRAHYIFNSEAIEDIIEFSIEIHQTFFEEKKITLTKVFPGEKTFVNCDSERLKQVFNNLIGNALKYSNSNSEIIITINNHTDHCEISVKDNGIGIDRTELTTIFSKFSRSKIRANKAYQGSGLGLTICSKIIDFHGGKIWVESEGSGKGATFFIHLPTQQSMV